MHTVSLCVNNWTTAAKRGADAHLASSLLRSLTDLPKISDLARRRKVAAMLSRTRVASSVPEYEFSADNLNWLERKMSTWRQVDRLIAQFADKDRSYGAFKSVPSRKRISSS